MRPAGWRPTPERSAPMKNATRPNAAAAPTGAAPSTASARPAAPAALSAPSIGTDPRIAESGIPSKPRGDELAMTEQLPDANTLKVFNAGIVDEFRANS